MQISWSIHLFSVSGSQGTWSLSHGTQGTRQGHKGHKPTHTYTRIQTRNNQEIPVRLQHKRLEWVRKLEKKKASSMHTGPRWESYPQPRWVSKKLLSVNYLGCSLAWDITSNILQLYRFIRFFSSKIILPIILVSMLLLPTVSTIISSAFISEKWKRKL